MADPSIDVDGVEFVGHTVPPLVDQKNGLVAPLSAAGNNRRGSGLRLESGDALQSMHGVGHEDFKS